MKYRTIILLVLALVGSQFVSLSVKAQSATSVRTYRVGRVGNLELTVPTVWQESSKTLEKPPAVTLAYSLISSKDFYMKVTTAWEQQEERSSRDPAWLRAAVQRAGQKLLSRASESKLELIEIKSANARGYYFQLTSKGNVPEGEFRYLTEGIVDLGKITLVFTTFSAKKDLPQIAESLQLVESARFVHTP